MQPVVMWTEESERGDADTRRFVLNGLTHANEVLGQDVFREEDWRVIGEYVFDEEGGRHQAFYSPLRDTFVLGELVRPHDRVQVEQSLKYSEKEAVTMWSHAGMREIGQWKHGNEYGESIIYTRYRPSTPRDLGGPLPVQGARSVRGGPDWSPTFSQHVGPVV